MKLAKQIRRLIRVYRFKETIINNPKRVRELLFLYGSTPSLGQVCGTINKHCWFIIRDEPVVPMIRASTINALRKTS